MIAGAPLAPDGLAVLAALLARHDFGADVLSAPLTAALATADRAPLAMAQAVARRAGPRSEAASLGGEDRSPVARFARRQSRRWRITQSTIALPPGLDLEGLRSLVASRRDPGERRDLAALAEPRLAHTLGHPPIP